MADEKKFGELFKETRIKLGLTLREFCEKHHLDPGNISKLETGKLSPPKEDILKSYARYLRIKKRTSEYFAFFDSAAIEAKRLPSECSDKDVIAKLPILFRTVRDKKLSAKKLNKLLKILKES